MFTLNTGSYRSLEEAFVKDLLAEKKADPLSSLLVLSPSAHQLTHLQKLLSMPSLPTPLPPKSGEGGRRPDEGTGFLNIHFLTFYALAERVMAESPATEDRVVTEPALYRELVQDFLEGREAVPFTSRDYLRRPESPIPRGLSGALASTLKDLQDSGAKVVDCANVAREGHLGDSTESAVPILELNVLMYKALHDRGLRTGSDFFRRAAERVPANDWIKQQRAIYFYGFYDLTGVQLDFVQAFASHPHAAIYSPFDKDQPAYAYGEKLLHDLRRKAPSVTVLPPAPVSDVKTAAYSCSGTNNEVWWAAKQILKQADAGVPFAQMTVVARTLEPYLNTLREVFETHHIPYALHSEEPVGAYPLIKTARQVLRGETIKKSPYVSLSPSPSPGGRGGQKTKTFPPPPGEGGRRPGEASWSDHVSVAKTLISSTLRLPKSADAIEQRQWDGLIGTIESLAQLNALGRSVEWDHFLEVLEDKLERLRLQLISDNVQGVQIMDVMTARGLSFDSVFVLGLNEKLFPRLIREDPFLSDAARSALAQALGCRLGRKMDGFQEEKLLFQLAVESARKQLHLSCQRSDEEGKALVVSLYLHDFLKTHGLTLEAVPRAWPERVQRVERETLTPKEVSIAFHREKLEPEALYRGLDWDRALLAHLLDSQSQIEAFGTLGTHDGLIGEDPLAKAILEQGLSPQTLKDLAECPFKVYSRKVLSLYTDEGEVEEGQLTHTGRGKLVHNILQTFYQRGLGSKDLEILIDEEFKPYESPDAGTYPLALQAEKSRILTMLKRFIPKDIADQVATGLKPAYFETAVTQEIKGVKLQGRIDRLDVGPKGFRVVDYKTGSGGISKGEAVDTAIMKGKSFQLPVYLALAKTLLESASATTRDRAATADKGSAVFYRLEEEDAVDEPLEIGANFWKEHGDRFYENLAFLVKNIATGSFYIRPSDNRGYCKWCDYRAICRREHKPTQIRAENSPLRKKHTEAFTPVKP